MGDIDIFVFYSRNITKIGTSLLQSFTFHITSSLFNKNCVQRLPTFTKNNYFPSYFHVNGHMICSNYYFFSSQLFLILNILKTLHILHSELYY